jgi:ectoine hydrolase
MWLHLDAHVLSYPDSYVQTSARHAFDPLKDVFAERNWSSARVGLEMDNFHPPAAALFSLQKSLPNANFIGATVMVNWLRAEEPAGARVYASRRTHP